MPWIAPRASIETVKPSTATAASTSSSVKPAPRTSLAPGEPRAPLAGAARALRSTTTRSGSLTCDPHLVRKARELQAVRVAVLVREHEQRGVRGAVGVETDLDLAR